MGNTYWYSVKRVAANCDVSDDTVRRWIKRRVVVAQAMPTARGNQQRFAYRILCDAHGVPVKPAA